MIKEIFYNIAQATYKMNVEIPGLDLGKDKFAPDLATYLQAIFSFLIWGAIILAMLMIIVGGFYYLSSAGTASRASEGKDRVKWAIYGLILALSSYVILNFINPDLVRPKLPGITALDKADKVKIILPPGPGSKQATQTVDRICYYQEDCNYDLKCETQRTEYQCPNDLKKFSSEQECEKEENCKIKCEKIEARLCKEQNVGGKVKFQQSCQDIGDTSRGNCFDTRLACRPNDHEKPEDKYCLPPSTSVCEDNNDCDIKVPICDADNICKTEKMEAIEPEEKTDADPFAISPVQVLGNYYYEYIPFQYSWTTRQTRAASACENKGEGWHSSQSRVCQSFFGRIPGQENQREVIGCVSQSAECRFFRYAKKVQDKNPEGNPLYDPETGEPVYEKKASCESLGPSWEKASDQSVCINITDQERNLCCVDKRELACCELIREVEQEGWEKIWPWDEECKQALKDYSSEIFGVIPGDCWRKEISS